MNEAVWNSDASSPQSYLVHHVGKIVSIPASLSSCALFVKMLQEWPLSPRVQASSYLEGPPTPGGSEHFYDAMSTASYHSALQVNLYLLVCI